MKLFNFKIWSRFFILLLEVNNVNLHFQSQNMLEVKNISFTYIKNSVIEEVSFSVQQGNTIAIIGESGCGKSTLLKLIYGLYDLNEGEIFYNDKPILGPKYKLIPGESFIKYLAQDFDLMPFISVEENVGKFLSNMFPLEKQARVAELLEMVQMTEFKKTKAKYLSGGQQQRVALAQVLALEPQILLLDEPFSQIDNFKKNSLRRNVFEYLKKKQITCIIATHDSTDALSFSDEIIVMQNGKIVIQGEPKNIFMSPKNKYVGSLFGDINEISFLDENGKKQNILVYPHQLVVKDSGILKVVVEQSYFNGSRYLIKAFLDEKEILFEHTKELKKGLIMYLDIIL